MTEGKKDLLVTPRKQEVLEMIKMIIEERKPGESRVRKLHKKLEERAQQMERPASKCLISGTIKTLVEAKVLVPVAKGIAPEDEKIGNHARSILYDWDQKAFEAYEIKIVAARPPKKRKQSKATKPAAPPVVEEAPAHEDWHLALKQEIKDKEIEYAALGIDIAQLKELDASAENVRMCFLQRRRR